MKKITLKEASYPEFSTLVGFTLKVSNIKLPGLKNFLDQSHLRYDVSPNFLGFNYVRVQDLQNEIISEVEWSGFGQIVKA